MPASEPVSSFLDATVFVLESAGRPLTASEIVAEALTRGLIKPEGKSPLTSMTARLYTHVRDAEHPRVVRLFEPGENRAVRGTVRWTLAPGTGDGGARRPS
jgi:hypothetical protein